MEEDQTDRIGKIGVTSKDQPKTNAARAGTGPTTITRESLVADLRTILVPHHIARAREIANRMTKPAESVMAAADLVENFARQGRVG